MRKAGRTKNIIDHAPNAHDDTINAVAGSLVECMLRPALPDLVITTPYVVSQGALLPDWARAGPNPFAPSGAIADYYEDKRSHGLTIKS